MHLEENLFSGTCREISIGTEVSPAPGLGNHSQGALGQASKRRTFHQFLKAFARLSDFARESLIL